MPNTRSYLLFAALLLFVQAATSYPQTYDNGKLIDRSAYRKAQFEAVKGLEKLYSKVEYDAALNDERFHMESVKYLSDGLTVSAILYGPAKAKAKLPVIIFNRGGYIRGDIGHELLPMFHRFAAEGFIVVAPMYRASDGAAGKDEVGGGDVNDLMNIVPLLRSVPEADINNLFLYGESRGGMMVFQAIRDNFPANAAATFGGFTDFGALVASDPKLYDPLTKAIWTDFDTKKDEIINRRSAMQWPEKIGVPLFLMHGGNDRSVDPQQTLNLALALQKLKKPFELHIYQGDGHTLSKNQRDRDARAAAWFKTHIK